MRFGSSHPGGGAVLWLRPNGRLTNLQILRPTGARWIEPERALRRPMVMSEKRIARLFGLSLGGLFIFSLVLNALAG